MATYALVLGAVLAVACVLFVARPFLREPVADDDRLDAPTATEEERLALVEERDHALGALKELEFDHRTGKVTDEDYRRDVGPLRQAAARALRALDRQPRYGAEVTEIPDLPPEPAPPPDEGTPPMPAPVPEPYPPPDEGTPPSIPQE